MKKQIVFLLIAMLAAGQLLTAQNQQRPGGDRPQMNPKERAEHMAKELSLTEEQKTKVQTLFDEQIAKMAEIRQQVQNDPEARRQKMQEMREKYDADLEKIIGKENMEKWRKMQQEQFRQQREQRQGDRPRQQRQP
jgi:Spy/CpxP family protein refolding chaperone